ncbi:MAG TPA: hypothetical protein VFB13_15630 [Reyranella sp.]|jgi:hypothetical protein|nr:hypothetical protein [Reyranella sp.]
MSGPFKLSIATLALALPAAALAQSNGDAAYCKALADKYQKYVGAKDFGRGSPPPNAAMSSASNNCSSDPAGSIPVLEKGLKAARIDLPPRT